MAYLLRGFGEEAADIHTLIHRFCALGTCRQSRECESRDVHRPEARTVQGMSREAGVGVTDGIWMSSGLKVTEGAIIRRPEDWPPGRPGS